MIVRPISRDGANMRCSHICKDGERCRQSRVEWLWVVEIDKKLRCLCSTHLRERFVSVVGVNMVSAEAMRDFFVEGGGPK